MRYNLVVIAVVVSIALFGCNKNEEPDVECLPPPQETPFFRLVDKNTGADVLGKYQDFTAANTPVAKESCSGFRVQAATFGYKKNATDSISYYFNWQYAPSLSETNCRTLYLQHKDGDIDTIKFDGYVRPASGEPCDITTFIIEKVYFNGAEVQPLETGKLLGEGRPNGVTYYPLKK